MQYLDYYEYFWWWDQYNAYSYIANLVRNIGSPITCAFGIFGNFMIIVIMLRLPASTFSVFFQLLAWSGLLLLLTDAFCTWLDAQFSVTHFSWHGSWQCKLAKMMFSIPGILSPWMLVALTMLRAASVLWPLQVNAVWTKGKSRVTAGVTAVVIVLMNCHFLYGFDIGNCSAVCCVDAASAQYRWFYWTIWPWVGLVAYCFLPFLLLLVSNTALLWTLVRAVEESTSLPVQQATQDSRQQKVTSLTVTLIAASVSFFLLTTPLPIHFITVDYIDWADPIQHGQYDISREVAHVLLYCNCGINFYLYCLTGARFRAEFQNMMLDVCGLFCKRTKCTVPIRLVKDNDAA